MREEEENRELMIHPPNQCRFQSSKSEQGNGPDALVRNLIDRDTKQWNREAVFSCFSSFEAKQICNIPISHRLPDDKLVWHWEKNGTYLGRSAYHQLGADSRKDLAGPSSSQKFRITVFGKKFGTLPSPIRLGTLCGEWQRTSCQPVATCPRKV